MEEYDYGFFEEPCQFDHLEDTKQVADALDHPGGRRRAGVQRTPLPLDDRDRAIDIVQPDLHYYGGFIRSMRVARMADVAGLPLARRTCPARASATSTSPISSRACPTPPRSTSTRGSAEIPVTSDTSSLVPRRRDRPSPHRPRLTASPSTRLPPCRSPRRVPLTGSSSGGSTHRSAHPTNTCSLHRQQLDLAELDRVALRLQRDRARPSGADSPPSISRWHQRRSGRAAAVHTR